MTILVLTNFDLGLYKFRKELIEELIRRGHKVVLSLPDGDLVRPFEKMGCIFVDTPIDRRGINPLKDFSLFVEYIKIIRRTNPDLIISYTIKPNIYGGIAASLSNKQYAVNITGLGTAFEKANFIRAVVIFLYKIALKRAKVVFCENSSNRDDLVAYGCCKKEKTKVLNGAGVNTETYAYLPYPNNSDMHFLFIGRVMKEKGIDELFAAMKRLINDGRQCVLDVVGPFEEDYKEVLMKCESEGWLKYHGYQQDVTPFIASCDCFVLPSYHEGMANTNLECASSGRPLITTNVPGCKEAVTDGSGILCSPKQVDDLYVAMSQMISFNREQRMQMGIIGRRHMEQNFDKKTVVEQTIERLFKGN